MPTVDIYYRVAGQQKPSQELVNKVKEFLAKKLSCGDIQLTPQEVSIRCIDVEGIGMIGDVEVEIKAAAFQERVEQQDEICRSTEKFLKEQDPSMFKNTQVWLILSELGHSWQ